MPRDLSAIANESTLSGMSEISKTPKVFRDTQMAAEPEDEDDVPQINEKRNALHPYTQTLSTSDVESCVRLEDAAFPPHERASRAKIQYRLKHCGELSLGIFTSQKDSTLPTAATSSPVYSGAPERKAVLLGHIIATKTTNAIVTDNDMAIPASDAPDPNLGHKEAGRTVCIHSLAVLPEYQNCGLGSTIMKAYIQRIESHGVADRIALIAHDHLIPFYERLGFENRGQSDAQFGGGGWYDMVRELESGSSDSP